MSDNLKPEMINQAEANIREDFRAGRISREQFQKEMLIVARARKYASTSKQEDSADGF
ncbi:hypothetical protein [Agrobacterium tumefaciens]|uniref:hypothetical protein n=1 Tax=Agrobacterium tumefaciens TaxID=358 RepID=UPI003BA2C9BC